MALLEINWKPAEREVRQFAAIWFPLLCVVATFLVYRGTHSWTWSAIPLAIGVLISPIAYWQPELGKALFLGCILITYPIGWVLSHVVMGVIFYVLITPMGLLMRLCGRDSMGRRFLPEQKSYWVPHHSPKKTTQYFRQY